MSPLRTEATNGRLVAPGCADLPVVRRTMETEAGPIETITSYWVPSPEDLAAFNAGLPLVLSFMGSTHPAILVRVGDDA